MSVRNKTINFGNRQAMVSAFGQLLTAEKNDSINVMFPYQLGTGYSTQTPVTTGDGSVSHSGNLAVLSSTTGTAKLTSRDSVQYKTGHGIGAWMTASFNGAGIGIATFGDDNNGLRLKYDNGTVSLYYTNDGVDSGEVTTFNGDDISSVDWTKINIIGFDFGYLGVFPPSVYVVGTGTKGKVLEIHTFDTSGTLTNTHVGTPYLNIQMETSGAMEIKSGSWNGYTYGNGRNNSTRAMHFPNTAIVNGVAAEQGEITLTSTNVGTLAVFHNKTTFNSKTNKIRVNLLRYKFWIDAPSTSVIGTLLFQVIANPTLSGAATYADIETNNSVMEVDHTNGTGASVTYASGGKVVLTEILDYAGGNKGSIAGSGEFDAQKLGLYGYPGDSFAIIAKDRGGNNVTVRFVFDWEELF